MPSLKCSRCGYVFLLPGAKKQSTPKRKTKDEEAPRQPLLFDDDEPAPPAVDESKSLGADNFVMGEESHELGLPRWTGARPAAPRKPAAKVVEPEPPAATVPELLSDEDAPADDLLDDDVATPAPAAGDDLSEESDWSDESEDSDETDLPEESDQSEELELAEESEESDLAEEPDVLPEPMVASATVAASEELEHVFEEPPAERPRRRGRASQPPPPEAPAIAPWVVFAGLVVLGYGVLTWSLLAQPARADRWIGVLPGFARFEPTAVLARSLVVARLDGDYERLGDREPAFVARGEVVSNATVALHDVQIRGKLLDASGAVLAEKTVYCGATASSAVLNDLDSREVSVVQRIQPPPRFALPPGHVAPFIMVFVNPPTAATEVVASVVSAREIER